MQNRYVGTLPFEAEYSDSFFGREKDIDDLFRVIRRENSVVLYSKSGIGKSSIINAGLIPTILKKTNYLPIKLRFNTWTKGETNTLLQKTYLSINSNQTLCQQLNHYFPDTNSLWLKLKNYEFSYSNFNSQFFFIFDQFEEVFTYPSEQIEGLFQEINQLILGSIPNFIFELDEQNFTNSLVDQEKEDFFNRLLKPVNIKTLFAIRSDRLSLLNNLTAFIPGILRNCYELKALDINSAKEAIIYPAKQNGNYSSSPFVYSEIALNSILNFVTANNTGCVETTQLQIICSSIERKIIYNKKEIVEVEDIGDIFNIIENFYIDTINQLNLEERETTRVFIEDGLIYEQEKRRLSIYEGQIFNMFKIRPVTLKKLVDLHLLRAEPSLSGGYTYELSHDTLIAPVLKAKNERLINEEKIQNKLKRNRQEAELAEAKLQANEERRKRQRVNLVSLIAIISLAISSAATVWAFQQKNKTELAEAEALLQKQEADKILIQLKNTNEISKRASYEFIEFVLNEADLQLKERYPINAKKYYTQADSLLNINIISYPNDTLNEKILRRINISLAKVPKDPLYLERMKGLKK